MMHYIFSFVKLGVVNVVKSSWIIDLIGLKSFFLPKNVGIFGYVICKRQFYARLDLIPTRSD